MIDALIDPAEPFEAQHERLLKIVEVLMRRVERDDNDGEDDAYAHFERAVVLEDQVRTRTAELEQALDLLNRSNAQLSEASRAAVAARADLANAIEAVREGFALFDGEDRLVMCNSRFGEGLRDVRPYLKSGLPFRRYITMVSQSPHLVLPKGTSSEEWAARRIHRHGDRHVLFNLELTGDHWLQVSEHRTPNGGVAILQTDVTDVIRIGREERDKLLDEQARMIRATLDQLNQGVAIFDRAARLAVWNRRLTALMGLSSSDVHVGLRFGRVSRLLQARFDVSDPAPLRMLAEWADGPARAGAMTFELAGTDGAARDVFAHQLPDGGFVVSVSDVTAERQAARALALANETLEARVAERTQELENALASAERANASKTRFVAAASHDLLQPLSAARLYIDSAVDGAPNLLLTKAAGALKSAESIIEALLDISRLDSGVVSVDIRPVALGELLPSLRDEFAPAAAAKGLDLRIVPSNAMAMSDPVYLRRILQNLIGNAIRYTETGKVLVGLRRMGGALRLEVWDTGPGIREEDQDLIFQEFQRLGARASASEGLGLGLAIVERACERLGHPLGLWSVPGAGSGFFINVPVAEGSSENGGRKPVHLSAAWRLRNRGLIVLVVEDDADLRRALTVLLEKWDVSVIEADSAAAALDLLEEIEITPDALLIDHKLGGATNGLELLGTLFSRYGRLPACIVSASRAQDLRAGCADLGVTLLSKPIDAGRLERFLVAAADNEV